jgi:hypothetical protein
VLIDTAAAHSQDMIDRNFFGHTNPDGLDFGDRLDKAGYAWQACAENLAFHLDPLQAHDALFQSQGHRLNMLRDSYREVGVGIAVRPDYGMYLTELFASRADDVFLTGVAFADQGDGDNFFSPGEGLEGVRITAAARDSGTTYTTVTGPTGGYSLQVPAGTYDLTAAEGELQNPLHISSVAVGAENVKVDFIVPMVGIPPDPFEPNDSFAQAKLLAADLGTLSHLSIHQPRDEDFFRWRAPANGRLVVGLDSGRGGGDLDLFLHDAQGGLLAAAQTVDPVERVEYDVAQGSEYYIHVAGYQDDTHSDYDLTITAQIAPTPPVVQDDRAMAQKDAPVVIEVLANDGGGQPPDVTSVTIVSQPQNGQAVADQATGQVRYTPGAGRIGPDHFTYQVRGRNGAWSSAARVFVTVVDLNDRPWRNPRDPRDVNADHLVTALDVLCVINDLNVNQAHTLPPPSPQGAFPTPYLDVTGDGRVSPQDVLEIVNFINSLAAGEGEASLPGAVTNAAPAGSRAALPAASPRTPDVPLVARGLAAGRTGNPELPLAIGSNHVDAFLAGFSGLRRGVPGLYSRPVAGCRPSARRSSHSAERPDCDDSRPAGRRLLDDAAVLLDLVQEIAT